MINLSKYSILVLEKDTLLCNVLLDVFDTFGVPTLLSTADPEIALDWFKAVPIDIVMIETAPDLDSTAFLNRLRTDLDSPNPFVPVIICTANVGARDVCEARDLGMTEYLTTPVSANQIYSRILSMFERDRQFIRVGDFRAPDHRYWEA
jgi:DNA-binding response OmpR family regulator